MQRFCCFLCILDFDITNKNIRTFFCKTLSNRISNSLCASGHQHFFISQIFHVYSFASLCTR